MAANSKTKPELPLKARLLLAIHSFSVDAAKRSNHTVNRTLFSIFDPKTPSFSKPINNVSSFDPSSKHLWFRLYTPRPASSTTILPLVVYFHGGGFCFMAANSFQYDQLCRRLARELPAVVISVNYRLAPEFKYPFQYDDGFAALKFIDKMNFEKFKTQVDIRRCFIAGDSAGANLGHHVVVKASEYNQFSNLEIIGFIAIQPFFGGEAMTEAEVKLVRVPVVSVARADWMWKAFLQEGMDREHPVVNVFGPNAVDISGLKFPRTVVFVGEFDILQDRQRRYCEWLEKAGKEVKLVEYPNAVHGFYTMPELPEFSLLIAEVRGFVQRHLGRV